MMISGATSPHHAPPFTYISLFEANSFMIQTIPWIEEAKLAQSPIKCSAGDQNRTGHRAHDALFSCTLGVSEDGIK